MVLRSTPIAILKVSGPVPGRSIDSTPSRRFFHENANTSGDRNDCAPHDNHRPCPGAYAGGEAQRSELAGAGHAGNADNVPFIGRRDPGNNPVRLARATGHVSNYGEQKVPPYTLPDPLVMASGERVDQRRASGSSSAVRRSSSSTGTRSTAACRRTHPG